MAEWRTTRVNAYCTYAGTDTTGPAAEDPLPHNGSILTYEEVARPTEIAGNLGNRHPEPLPRPLLPGTRLLPPHTDDTVSDDGNYIEIVEDTNNGTGEASVSVEIPPPPGLTPSSTLNKRVTREEVRSFRQRRWSSGKSEDDEVPLLGDPVSKSGYKSTEKVLSLPARTLPNRAEPGSKLAHRQVHTLCQRPREGRDDGGGHISQSNDAASSDDTVSSNPAAVRVWSLSLPAREEYT